MKNFSLALCAVAVLGWANLSPLQARTEDSLRSLAEPHQIFIGTCVSPRALLGDAQYAEILKNEYNMVTAENAMKFHQTQPQKGEFSFNNADTIVDFALQHDMKVRGHTLVWHLYQPKWLTEKKWEKDELNAILKNHINTVAGRYRGKIHAWDVVNEAIETDGSMRESFWYQTLGRDYIDNAFRWAREADPEALLIYNDFDSEGLSKKSDAIYNLVKGMQERGVPIDGVGFQLHVKAADYAHPDDIRKNIQRLGALGLEVHFTEIDVRVKLPADAAKLKQQAQCYRDLMNICLSEPNCTSFVTWGFTDKYSWVYRFFPGFGDALVFDKDYQAKPAYTGLQEILKNAVKP